MLSVAIKTKGTLRTRSPENNSFIARSILNVLINVYIATTWAYDTKIFNESGIVYSVISFVLSPTETVFNVLNPLRKQLH